MRMVKLSTVFILLVMILIASLLGQTVHAGNIDPGSAGSAYAYGENIGWINLNPSYGGGVTVTDSALSGFAWVKISGGSVSHVSARPPAGL